MNAPSDTQGGEGRADPRRQFFDQAAGMWDQRVPAGTDSEAFTTWSQTWIRPGGAVLEVGCGTGRVLSALRVRGPEGRRVGLDLSWQMLTRASPRAAAAGAWLIQGHCACLPFQPASFDMVCIVNTFPHLHPLGKVLSELHRVLRAGGTVHVLHTASRESVNAVHRALSTVSDDMIAPALELEAAFAEAGFRILCAEDQPTHFLLSVCRVEPRGSGGFGHARA